MDRIAQIRALQAERDWRIAQRRRGADDARREAEFQKRLLAAMGKDIFDEQRFAAVSR